MFITGKLFRPSLMFVGKVRSLPYSIVYFSYSSQVGSSLTHKHKMNVEGLARDKHFSLLQTFLNYEHKKSYNVGPLCQLHKIFFFVTNGETKKLECRSQESFLN